MGTQRLVTRWPAVGIFSEGQISDTITTLPPRAILIAMGSEALPPNEVREQVERESARIHVCDAIRHPIDEFKE